MSGDGKDSFWAALGEAFTSIAFVAKLIIGAGLCLLIVMALTYYYVNNSWTLNF